MSRKKFRELVVLDGRYKDRRCRSCDLPAEYKSRFERKDGRRGHAYHCQEHAEIFAARFRILMPGDQLAFRVFFDHPDIKKTNYLPISLRRQIAPTSAPEQLNLLEVA